ncbi:MAG: TetR/AcrR family transcriptional regulator [Gammaproteobacteria bacterium]
MPSSTKQTNTRPRKARRLDPEKRRAQLLACSLEAFAEQGIARATHSHVAALAGVSTPAVHSYFRTREDLRDATLARVEEFLDCIVAANLLGVRASRDELVDLAHAFAAAATETPALVMVWLDWSTSVGSDTWPSYLRVLEKLHAAARAAVLRAQQAGEAPAGLHPDTAARLYIGGGHTIALMQFEGAAGPALDRFIRHMVAGAMGLPVQG